MLRVEVLTVCVFIGCRMLCLLDPSKVDEALALVTDLSDSLVDRNLEVIRTDKHRIKSL